MSPIVMALILALTRAEIIQWMKAPVLTQANGLIKVFADCPEDMRREYQSPIASYASETVRLLYSVTGERPRRFEKPGIVVHIGSARTNLTEVVVKAETNNTRVVTQIKLKSPGYADLDRFRIEIIKAFYRSVKNEEVDDLTAIRAYRKADPRLRVADLRGELERWLAGKGGDDEEMINRMRRIIEPGYASKRDILIFASRLFLYPPANDLTFAGRYDVLSFKDAIKLVEVEPRIRLIARQKADEMPLFGGGKGDKLRHAAEAYREFLMELAKNELNQQELDNLLEAADSKLALALEEAK